MIRGRPLEDRHELPALLAACGLSSATPVTFHVLRGAELDDAWGDYRVEWAVIPDTAWRPAPTDRVIAHPMRVQLPGWDAPRIILRWRQWRPGTSTFLERSWALAHGQWRERIQVRAIGRFPARRAFEAFASLSGEPNRLGRKPDDLEDWLSTEVRSAIADAIAIGHRPDQSTIAARLGLSPSGLRKKLDQLNVRRRRGGQQRLLWRHLIAELLAITPP
ncbi:MAG TPA: hypothetical protein VF808_13085 [Ktedonobacterales bacterium]